MRVALVLGTSTGGVGNHVRDLAVGFTALGHDVTIACPSEVAGHFGFAATGARVHPVEFSDRPSARGDAAAVTALRTVLASAEVVHAHGLRAGAFAALARPGTARLVVTLHNAAPSGWAKGLVYAALERIVARRADLVLGVSGDLVERMARLGARSGGLAVVPAPPLRVPARDRAAVRAELGVPDQAALLVSIGRLSAQKRPLDLAALAARVHVEWPVVVAVAGDGPLRDELARVTEGWDWFRLLGHRGDIPDLLAAADIAVSAAQWEGQPLWLQEALQHGCPVVATDVGGTGAVLVGAGLLFARGDVEAGAAQVLRILTDPAFHADLVERSRRRARSLPTTRDAVAAALAAYDQARH